MFESKGGAFFVAMNGRDDEVQEVSLKTLKNDVMPNHLLVLVHGILASPNDWKYVEGELRRQLSSNFLIYASAVNSYLQTFTGIDVAGRRLAEEVHQVVKKNSSLKRISFLAHSLGGLFARYAIAILLSSDDDDYNDAESFGMPSPKTIAGLDPVNFITLATPHLGVRGKNQPPKKSLDGYKHVVNVIYCPPICTHEPLFQQETAQAKEAAQISPSRDKTTAYYERIEDEMIRGLQQVGWRKVDVSFHAAFWPFFAHNHIHVKQEWLHYEGAGVVAHVADTFKQQERHTFIAANL